MPAAFSLAAAELTLVRRKPMSRSDNIIPLRFFLGGREVTHANWHKFGPEVTEDRVDAVADSIYETIGPLRCAIHGKKAQLDGHGDSLSDMQFTLTTCCEAFHTQVDKALENVRPSIRWK